LGLGIGVTSFSLPDLLSLSEMKATGSEDNFGIGMDGEDSLQEKGMEPETRNI
jgi:hypothetical protein